MADDNDKSPLTRRRVLGGMATVGAAGAVGAGTWAAFSDQETSSGNSVQAGTLDLELNQENTLSVSAVGADAGPQEVTTKVNNAGSLRGALSAKVANVNSSEGQDSEPETDTSTDNGGELDNHLNVSVRFGQSKVLDGNINSVAGKKQGNIDLPSGDTRTMYVGYDVNDAPNAAQGDEVTFDVIVYLE
ncbi:SipW-dependent-type signal peptide-containing protein [Halococcus dombrowskii]|uniref:SipW-dependent-type signal peptide-containing protein n=1 Tax=Halococcus dombrowskii TaxID=179637 RepID=A0AAV3SFD7_HALDO|nr:TasA family protein [Halococcus dombrowskii]UOO94656.1 SipW-dependent-type signal peptide-containing protein [Halococcus dombrowskii]